MKGLIVTFTHLRTVPGYGKRPGYCSGKSREWFARHGYSWSDFLARGIEAEKLLATGCALARALVEHAQRVEGEAADGQ